MGILTCVAHTEPKCYTVEEAVESIGFGRFHILLFVIMGSANVRQMCVFVSVIH